MIYFDYCSTTFPEKEVIKEFTLASSKFIGNPNSDHKLGEKAKEKINESTQKIAELLNVNKEEIIYTSGASEANNLAIKGVCLANKGKHIITTSLEHSSVIAPINRLCNQGYDVSIVNHNEDGMVDINHLKSLITDDTVLVSIVAVDSELGIRQNIEEIGEMLKDYPNCYFHVDATQLIGKYKFDFKDVDLFSFSAHKFFGIKGIGCLIKKKDVRLMSLIDGGASTTKYRSGTPCLELIISLEKALRLSLDNIEKKINYVNELSSELKEFLLSYDDILLNITKKSIGNVINFSVLNSNELISKLNENDVYLSSKSACSNIDSISKSVFSLYKDEKRASNSIRISISYKTTKKEIKKFKDIFDKCYKELKNNENNKI